MHIGNIEDKASVLDLEYLDAGPGVSFLSSIGQVWMLENMLSWPTYCISYDIKPYQNNTIYHIIQYQITYKILCLTTKIIYNNYDYHLI